MKEYYKILEVNNTASPQEIKKSYRRLAVKYHPDKNSGNKTSEAKFKELHEAYRVLSDEKKRKEYNYKRYDNQHGLNKKSSIVLNPHIILQKSKHLKKTSERHGP